MALAVAHETIIVSEVKSFLALTFTKTLREALVAEGLIVKYRLICFCKWAREKKRQIFCGNAGYLPIIVFE